MHKNQAPTALHHCPSFRVTRWSSCALSGQPLAAPVVACFLGRLYNKSAVLEFLLARAGHFAAEADAHRYINQLRESGDAFDHITSMKDVFPLQYAPATAPADAQAVATGADGDVDPLLPAPFSCPITQLRCDVYPFAALRPCGHVFSERALKEAAGDGTCPTCGAAFSAADNDVVPLVPSEEQVEQLRELLPGRRKQGKQQRKKQKERQKNEEEAGMQQQQQQQSDSGQQEAAAATGEAAAARRAA